MAVFKRVSGGGRLGDASSGVIGRGATIRLYGSHELEKALRGLKKSVRKRILGKAVRAGAKPALKRARADAPSQTGSLKRSLFTKVKRYKNGNVVAVIGPRWGKKTYKATKRKEARTEDAYYAWMVERGSAPHQIDPINAEALMIPGYGFYAGAYPGGKRQTRFLERSFKMTKKNVESEFMKKAWAEVRAEAIKARKAAK